MLKVHASVSDVDVVVVVVDDDDGVASRKPPIKAYMMGTCCL